MTESGLGLILWRWWCLELSCIPVTHVFASKEQLLDFVTWHNREYHDGLD